MVDDDALRESEPSAPGPARLTPPLRILIVDDHADSLDVLELALVRAGHECRLASDGDEAWDTLQTFQAEAILCDWAMPRMGGLELCQRVREQPDVPYTYFVLMSGLVDRAYADEARAAGADDYLTKPFDLVDVERRCARAVSVIGMQRELGARMSGRRARGPGEPISLFGAGDR